MNTGHKNDGASFRNKDQTGVGHACPYRDLNSGEDILLQEGSMRKLRAQQIRVHKMAEFEKSCDAIFPGIRREIIALSKSAQFVAVQEMKAAELKGDKDGSLSAEEIEKLSPIAQKFAKLDVVDQFSTYRLIDLLFEMIFEEADARETDIKLRHGN